MDAIALVILVVGLIIAIGLWRLHRWAWAGVMIWTGVNLATALYQYFHGRPDYAAMAEGMVVVFYLNQRDVRQAFEPIRAARERAGG